MKTMLLMLWMLFCALPSLAFADLLPQVHYDLRQRKEADPQAYDRADQFCVRKNVGSVCSIPGSPFDGGGGGHCKVFPNDDAGTLDAICVLDQAAEVFREIPDGGFAASEKFCEAAKADDGYANALRAENLACGPTPTLPDNFCQGKSAGDACVADGRVGGSNAQFSGRCQEKEQTGKFYAYGYNLKTRKLLACLPEHPVTRDIQPSSPPSWLQRLLQ